MVSTTQQSIAPSRLNQRQNALRIPLDIFDSLPQDLQRVVLEITNSVTLEIDIRNELVTTIAEVWTNHEFHN